MNRRTVIYEIPLIPGDKFYVPYPYFMEVKEYEVSRVIINRNSIEVEIKGNFDIGEEVTYNLDLLGKEIFASEKDAYKYLEEWKKKKQQN